MKRTIDGFSRLVAALLGARSAVPRIVLLVVVVLLGAACTSAAAPAESGGPAGDVPGLLPPPALTPDGANELPMTVGPAEVSPSAQEVSTQPTADPLACLSRRDRIAQLLLPLATQAELVNARDLATSGDLGGVGLLGEPDQGLAAELALLQQASFVPVLVASDEEGGSVQRLGALLGPLPSAATVASDRSPEDVRKLWLEYGARVRALGVDVVFGPVVDVGSGPGIESRSFGDDPAEVAEYAGAVADGLLEAGIMPVFKHFPGHGRATADSHLELPTAPTLDELRAVDLLPYVDLLERPDYQGRVAVMVGHLAVPGLSDSTPTSLSPATVDGLLRSELGFTGLVFTDAMNMGAIVNTYGIAEALELAFVAGADVAILGSLADVAPALDYLVGRADADSTFASLLDNRTHRVLAIKGVADICSGAQ